MAPLFHLPRLSSDQTLNNVYLVTIGVAGSAVIIAILGWMLMGVARRLAKAGGASWIARLGEQLRRSIRVFATILILMLVLGGCSLAAYAVLRGVDLQGWLDQSGYFTPEAGKVAARSAAVIFGVLILAAYLRWLLAKILPRLEERLRRVEVFAGQGEEIKRFVKQLEPVGSNAVVLIAFTLASRWLDLAGNIEWLIKTILFVLIVGGGARAAITLVHLVTEALDRMGSVKLENTRLVDYYRGIRRLWPLGRRVFEAIAYLAAATLIVGRFDALEELAPFGPRVIKLLGIFFGARVVVELSRVLVGDAMTRGLVGVDEVRKKRVTLVYLVQSLVKYAIYFFAALTMMREVGLDPTPILAGAGIVGLAVGLGAQKLVNDVVSGFFILFEGQILAGDFIKVGDAAGLVEDVQLRVTLVRDDGGRVHVLRNGDIGTVINYSRRYVHAVVEMPIAYESDVKEVSALVEEAGRLIKERHPSIVLEPTVAKLQNFQENAMLLRTETKVAPGCHDDLEPEIRSVLAEVFRAKGVEVPYPRRIHVERASGSAAVGPSSRNANEDR